MEQEKQDRILSGIQTLLTAMGLPPANGNLTKESDAEMTLPVGLASSNKGNGGGKSTIVCGEYANGASSNPVEEICRVVSESDTLPVVLTVAQVSQVLNDPQGSGSTTCFGSSQSARESTLDNLPADGGGCCVSGDDDVGGDNVCGDAGDGGGGGGGSCNGCNVDFCCSDFKCDSIGIGSDGGCGGCDNCSGFSNGGGGGGGGGSGGGGDYTGDGVDEKVGYVCSDGNFQCGGGRCNGFGGSGCEGSNVATISTSTVTSTSDSTRGRRRFLLDMAGAPGVANSEALHGQPGCEMVDGFLGSCQTKVTDGRYGNTTPKAMQVMASGSALQTAAVESWCFGMGGSHLNSNIGDLHHYTAPHGVFGSLGFSSTQQGRDLGQQLPWIGPYLEPELDSGLEFSGYEFLTQAQSRWRLEAAEHDQSYAPDPVTGTLRADN